MRAPLLCLLTLLPACAIEPHQDIADWTLHVDGAKDLPLLLPQHLDAWVPDRPLLYRLRTTVMPSPALRGGPLTLTIAFFSARVALRVNGVELAPTDDESLAGYRTVGPHRWQIPAPLAAAPTLALELEVDHRWTRSAWLDTVPRLSAAPWGDRAFRWIRGFNLGINTVMLAMFAVVFLQYAVVFFQDQRRRSHGWMALQSAAVWWYPFTYLGYSQRLFGTFDLALMVIFVSLNSLCSVYFLHTHLGLGKPSRAWLYGWLVVVATVLAFHGPFQVTRFGIPVGLIYLVTNINYQIIVTTRLLTKPNPPLNTAPILVCWMVVAIFGGSDFTGWIGLGEMTYGVHAISLATAIFTFTVMIALSREHAANILFLETRNREVQTLNEELRRQIQARSTQLQQALARLGRGAAPGATLSEGALIGERYRVVQPLGAGAMGIVYEVARLSDGRPLAAKVIRGAPGAQALSRLAREAEITAKLDHTNVIGIGDLDIDASGALFIVMELVRGSTVAAERARFGQLPWARPILRQIASGLDTIHRHGVVHRDLKPSNILLSAEGVVKIGDFGLSSLRGPSLSETSDSPELGETVQALSASPDLTRAGEILGTPNYMAPELARGAAQATAAADLFSFGVLAYELCTGRLPFAEPVILRKLQHLPFDPAASIAEACPTLDAALVALIDACLKPDPAARPTAAALLAAL
jgi:serine/threonine-protein kinase